jgi:hypothetical protein
MSGHPWLFRHAARVRVCFPGSGTVAHRWADVRRPQLAANRRTSPYTRDAAASLLEPFGPVGPQPRPGKHRLDHDRAPGSLAGATGAPRRTGGTSSSGPDPPPDKPPDHARAHHQPPTRPSVAIASAHRAAFVPASSQMRLQLLLQRRHEHLASPLAGQLLQMSRQLPDQALCAYHVRTSLC